MIKWYKLSKNEINTISRPKTNINSVVFIVWILWATMALWLDVKTANAVWMSNVTLDCWSNAGNCWVYIPWMFWWWNNWRWGGDWGGDWAYLWIWKTFAQNTSLSYNCTLYWTYIYDSNIVWHYNSNVDISAGYCWQTISCSAKVNQIANWPFEQDLNCTAHYSHSSSWDSWSWDSWSWGWDGWWW